MQARKIEAHASGSPAIAGDWHYWVASRDLRRHNRLKTRLRSGKLLDADRNFLSEYNVRDISRAGLRVRIARAVIIPADAYIFDDLTREFSAVSVVWSHAGESGMALCAAPISSKHQRSSFTICYAA